MLFDNFTRKLRTQAQLWRDEGLIDGSVYEQLAERYQFNQLEAEGRSRFVFILIILGSILLGLGVITFVAANWQALSREVKLVVLLGFFLASSIGGFYLWRQPFNTTNLSRGERRRKRLLGEGLLFVSALSIGANMGLLAQMFHIGGSPYQLYFAWGLAVLLMAYGLRLTSLGMLALILLLIGYFSGFFDSFNLPAEESWGRLVVEHITLVLGALFVPLAYLCRSPWIFRVAAIAFAITLQFNLRSLSIIQYANAPVWMTLAGLTLPPALLWSYDDLLFPGVSLRRFQPITRTLTPVFLSFMFYILSFRWIWEFRTQNYTPEVNQPKTVIVDVIIFTILAVWQWWHLLRPKRNRQKPELEDIIVGALILISGFALVFHQQVAPVSATAIFTFNLLLAVLGFWLIRQALELGKRNSYWGGIVLLTLQIITRMLEYDTGLLFKSLVFVLCGIAVIGAGLWFERYLNDTKLQIQNKE